VIAEKIREGELPGKGDRRVAGKLVLEGSDDEEPPEPDGNPKRNKPLMKTSIPH